MAWPGYTWVKKYVGTTKRAWIFVEICPHGHEVTEASTYVMRTGQRQCRTCIATYNARKKPGRNGRSVTGRKARLEEDTCRNGHLLLGDNFTVMEVGNGVTKRYCRECKRDYYTRKKSARERQEE
jgi:hypothetical protein